VGSPFGYHASERALFAFDGDPDTAWTTGDFGSAVGQSITLELDHERAIGSVTIRPAATSPKRLAAVRVTAGGRDVDVGLTGGSRYRPVVVPLGVRTDRLTFTITDVGGTEGVNPVGVAEITVPGVEVTETVRLPRGLLRVSAGLAARDRQLLARVPIDVVLKRQGLPRGSSQDEERALDRTFWLPDERAVALSGRISPGPGLADPEIDALAGPGRRDGRGVTARSSSRWRGLVEHRASQAVDGDRSTGWSPATRDEGEWIEVSFPRRRVDHVVIRQPAVLPGIATVTRGLLSLDGRPPTEVTLAPGATRIDVPARRASRARLTITGVGEFGDQVQITELDLGTGRIPPSPLSRRLSGCATIGILDGEPLRATLRGTVGDLDQPGPFDLRPCAGDGVRAGQGIRLGAGQHRLRAANGWLLDELRLASTPSPRPPDPPAVPSGRVLRTTRTTASLTTRQAEAPYYLVLGQGYDRRWTATMDGRPLGPPILVDGYSTGWRIGDLGPHRFEITYAPQRPTAIAQAFSLVSLVVLMTIWLRGRRGGRRR
jgi:arabinofuranan 3-O-arabinosyltransferase